MRQSRKILPCGSPLGTRVQLQKGAEFADKILMKTVPGDGELRLACAGKKYRIRVDLVLSEQIEWIDLESMKHQPSIISCLPCDSRGARENAARALEEIDDNREREVYCEFCSLAEPFNISR